MKVQSEWDKKIFPRLSKTFGSPSDINGDGKVDILVLDIRDGARPNGPFVAGFFDPIDLNPDLPGSFLRSNEREVLYMDGRELVQILGRDPLAFLSTLAHEFQHLIRYPRMLNRGFLDEIWINEGTSEVASDLAGFGPQQSRLDCLAGALDSPCAGGGNGVSLQNWFTNPENESSYILKQYSYAYAYMNYLYENSGITRAERNRFFFESVNGRPNSGSIGSNTGSLVDLFEETTRGGPNGLLPSETELNHTKLLNIFWLLWLEASSEDIDRSGMIRANPPGSPENFDLTGFLDNYSLPGNWSMTYSEFPIRNSIPGSLLPGAAYFLHSPFPQLESRLADRGTRTMTAAPGIYPDRNLLTHSGLDFQARDFSPSWKKGIQKPIGKNLWVEFRDRESKEAKALDPKGIHSKDFSPESEESKSDHKNYSGKPNPVPLCGHGFLNF